MKTMHCSMQEMKKVVIVNGKAIFDIESLFARLLIGGQQRGVEVTDIFQYELSPVPPSLIDEFGCFRKETAKDHERMRPVGQDRKLLPSNAKHTIPIQRSNPGEFQEHKSPRQHPAWISHTE